MKKILNQVELEIERRDISEDEVADILSSFEPTKNRRIIYGYASVSIVDIEGHRISLSALKEATDRFMVSGYPLVNVFHCLAPETMILVTGGHKGGSGRKYIPISEAKTGMRVYTHTGRSQLINKVIEHENNGIALKIILDNGEVIRITDEHPVLTKRGWINAGNLKLDDTLLKLEAPAKAYHDKVRGLTHQEIFGIEKSNEIMKKIKGPRDHYTLTDKHNSQQRKGHTWQEVYGHERPYYGGSSGEKNPQFGNIGRITGPKNPNWNNGSSFEEYGPEFNFKLKEKIRKSCDNKCFLCGIQAPYRLPVHHIDHNKKNNQEDNLIALCRKCHAKAHNEERLAIKNGTNIKSIEKFWYTGKVYNLEVDIDHTYVGRGIIYHNSDISVGKVLSKWTDPESGKIYTTEVDDTGWKVVCELRDDIEIADKVWQEILNGNLRSFSIAGSSKSKTEKYEQGKSYTSINALDLAEVTICEQGINQMSKFSILWDPERVSL